MSNWSPLIALRVVLRSLFSSWPFIGNGYRGEANRFRATGSILSMGIRLFGKGARTILPGMGRIGNVVLGIRVVQLGL